MITALLLLTGVANFVILLNRNSDFKYTHYRTLPNIYNTDATLYLKNLAVKNGIASLTLSQKVPAPVYRLWIDGVAKGNITPGENNLSFSLIPAFHRYILQPADSSTTTIEIHLDYFGKDQTEAELLYTNLPGPTSEFTPLKTWLNGEADFTKEELQKARAFLPTIDGWKGSQTDYDKVVTLARFCAGVCNRSNAPLNPETLKAFTPWQQLNKALQCQSSLNCGSYTLMFHFLLTAAGIPSRGVSLGGGSNSGWQYGVHFFNEAFIKEKNGWVMFDGLANMLLPHDSTGHFYTAADIKTMTETGTINPAVKVFFTQNGNLQEKPLTDYLPHLNYYFHNNAALSFHHPGISLQKSRWQMLWEFYSFNDDVSYYSTTKQNNYFLIGVKMFFFYAFLVFLLLFFIQTIRVFRKQH